MKGIIVATSRHQIEPGENSNSSPLPAFPARFPPSFPFPTLPSILLLSPPPTCRPLPPPMLLLLAPPPTGQHFPPTPTTLSISRHLTSYCSSSTPRSEGIFSLLSFLTIDLVVLNPNENSILSHNSRFQVDKCLSPLTITSFLCNNMKEVTGVEQSLNITGSVLHP